MAVIRIVPNVPTDPKGPVAAFYRDVLGMAPVMDHGWIVTLAGSGEARPQISFATEGGAGTPVPALSIEVDDLDAAHQRAVAEGHRVEYGPATEPWGVRRFFVRDPLGQLLNILQHA